MLSYIFWHWRYPHIEKAAYQQFLGDFHSVLNAHKPHGFRYSTVFQLSYAPWIAEAMGVEVYEDWYVLDNSAALDVLNEAAVSGACREPHNKVAQCAAGGTGGLYRLRTGKANLETTRVALWFSKPAGMSYEELYAALSPEISKAKGSLWGRQMTLGPAREFCWHSAEEQVLPGGFDCLKIELTRI